MTSFITAMQSHDTVTENGMVTHSTSSHPVVDLFFRMGGSRQMTDAELVADVARAYAHDPLLTLRAIFYNRDVRGGQGERRSFRVFFRWLCEHDHAAAINNVHHVPLYGRWDDLFVAVGTPVEGNALGLIAEHLRCGDALCAKWMPREGKPFANHVRRALGVDWKGYRQLLASCTNVVESKMCAKAWGAIEYSHVPSVAANRYRKAFARQDQERYAGYLAALERGDPGVKVNAGAIFPHDIVRPFIGYSDSGATAGLLEAQWKALPDYMPKGRRILPMADVSGSMTGLPMEVSIALGIYCAERNVGAFQNALLTFSATPEFAVLRGATLQERITQVARMPWGMNTNLEAAFVAILNRARQSNVAPEDMPDTLLILSDMQFDQCVRRGEDTALGMIDRMYADAGYARPQVVFWNLRTSAGIPVKHTQAGTALVSGFSPSILASVLGEAMTPETMMRQVLESERYAPVHL